MENLGFRVSGIDVSPFPGLGRRNNARKWIRRTEKHLWVQFGVRLRVLGQVAAPIEGVSPKYPSQYISKCEVLQVLA